MDLEDLEQKLSASRARILLLCNPQNPSGRLWSFDELKNLYYSVKNIISM